MKILILSRTPWTKETSFGNTYSNFFEGMNNIEIANIYCGYGMPNTSLPNRYFNINERSILRSIFTKTVSGSEIFINRNELQIAQIEVTKMISKAKNHKWRLIYWLRALIWKTGLWKSEALYKFLDDFQADVIFSPFYYSNYMNDIKIHLAKYLGIPVVSYVSDDIFSMKQYSINPFFWIERLINRQKIKKSAKINEFLYVISKPLKIEYTKSLHKDCRILRKGINIQDLSNQLVNQVINKPIRFVYTGNLCSGRWRTLGLVAKAIKHFNIIEDSFALDIYTSTYISKKIKKLIVIHQNIVIHDSVPFEKLSDIFDKSDFLLHCESFKLKDKGSVRLSFSTKIVDYLASNKPILAVGPSDLASIKYIEEQKIGIIANKHNILNVLENISKNKYDISEYIINAKDTILKNHDITKIQDMLYSDLKEII